MEQKIRSEIRRFVEESPANRFPNSEKRYFDEPLVGFAAAGDSLFTEYKRVIGEFHLAPEELLSGAAAVIAWVLPITEETRASNRRQAHWPSRAWSLTRAYGEAFNAALRRHLVAWLEGRDYRAVAPQLSPAWQEYPETPVGVASAWSERHAAYAAGLGTFSLNDALITNRGIAHRLGSVITDLRLSPSPRPYRRHRENCLFFRDGSCSACINRCPVGALSEEGHDKAKCRDYVYGAVPQAVGKEYAVSPTGCGLCQTKIPCEAGIPQGRAISDKGREGTGSEGPSAEDHEDGRLITDN